MQKNKIKNVANKYLDQAIDSIISDLSNKIAPKGDAIDFSQMYPMELYTKRNDPVNPLYQRSHRFNILKMIDKLPSIKLKKGFKLPGLMSDHHAI